MTNITLPQWAPSIRPHQVSAVQQILHDFSEGSQVVFYDGPTGSGKTLVAELVRQNLNARSIYLCSSLSLQHQYMRDFPKAALLMGRSNYPTRDYPHLYGSSFTSITCADCTKKKANGIFTCKWCQVVRECPYEQAKISAARSSQVCSNIYYFLYEANHPGTLRGRQLVVIDEADTLESILMSYIQVSFTDRQIAALQLPVPSKKTVETSWIEWATESQSRLRDSLRTVGEPTNFSPPEHIKQYNRIDRALSDVRRLTNKQTGLESGGWVYTGYRQGHVEFKPIKVDRFAQTTLWKHGLRFLLMSATLISTEELADSLGLNMTPDDGMDSDDNNSTDSTDI